MLKYIKAILFLFIVVIQVKAQTGSQRTLFLKASSDTIFLDSLSIVNGSLIITSGNKLISNKEYILNTKKNFLILKNTSDSVRISYKVYPINFNKEHYNKDISMLNRDQSLGQNPFIINYNAINPITPIFQNDGLSKNGSISRGISFGNNQDVVVNSNMNLQVAGKLSNDINLVLAATDNNIPIQPDGNTQQLQEFDKVFIQLNDENNKLIMGDFQLSRPKSYFMNYYKRTQGLYFENNFTLDSNAIKTSKLSTKVSGAISRGKFARNTIIGIENNQGPYRLRGADNELFIIVLSGTEKVYIDGKLVERGQEKEYVIDYNTSEITFTAKQIITKDKRITVEFQYSERNYNRSLYYVGEEYKSNKLDLGFHLFSEQDNKNKPFQQELSATEKLLLRNIGDTLSLAITDGASVSDFNTTEVFYDKMDTIATSGTYNIYKYSTSPDTAYRVRFSYVGEGNGNYKQIQSLANGKVYQWTEPVSGAKQGNYEPIVIIITPKQKQMYVTTGAYKLKKNGAITWEGALTKNDINTFSSANSKDDKGLGGKINFDKKIQVLKTDSSQTKSFIITNASYEVIDKHFSQIERFRAIEFTRDWNRRNDSVKNIQHIAGAQIGFDLKGKMKSIYTGNAFIEEGNYEGFRHQLMNSYLVGPLSIQFNPSFLQSKDKFINTNTQFYRHKTNAKYVFKKVAFGYIDELEQNQFNYKSKDSVLANSYAFWEREGNISKADTTGNVFKVFYRERTDKRASGNRLKSTAYAQNYGFSADINSIRNHTIRATITYRQLQILDSLLINTKPDNTLLSRLEYSPKIWKGFIQGNVFYEIGYGLEQRKEYSFVQVAAGQGQYYWNDYNGNGIKELNEFEIAQYTDQATFIKIFTPTNSYVKAAHNQFSGSIYLRPSVFKNEKSNRFIKLISRFATQTVYRADNKSIATSSDRIYNPFNTSIPDSTLMSNNSSFRQAFFFNQNSAIGGFDYNYQDNKIKQLLVNGLESRTTKQHELRTRINFTKAWGFFTNSTAGNKNSFAAYLGNRNYNIQFYETEPRISYQPNTAFRTSVGYKRSEKKNAKEYGNQKASIDDILVELKYNKLSKGSFILRADYLRISYNDVLNSPIAFEMLNSLKPGDNFTWNLNYQQNLSAYLQISFNYEGRKSPGNRIIHIGGAQVRAFF